MSADDPMTTTATIRLPSSTKAALLIYDGSCPGRVPTAAGRLFG